MTSCSLRARGRGGGSPDTPCYSILSLAGWGRIAESVTNGGVTNAHTQLNHEVQPS